MNPNLQSECAATIEFLMAQIERLAQRAFSDPLGTERWLANNDAMNAGKSTLAKLKNPNAETKQAYEKGRWT